MAFGIKQVFQSNQQVVGIKNMGNLESAVTYSGSNGGYTYRQAQVAVCDAYDISFVFVNPLDVLGAGTANAITVQMCLETVVNGDCTFYPITYKGQQSFTIEPDQIVVTDPLPILITKGTQFYFRTFVSSSSNKWPGGLFLAAGAGEGYLDGNYTNFPSTATARSNNTTYYNGTSAVTGTPTPQNSWSNPGGGTIYASDSGSGYGPVLTLGKPADGTTPYPVVALIGDSICQATGANELTTFGGLDFGYMQQAVYNAGGCWVTLGQNGAQTNNFTGTTGYDRLPLLKWCTHALVEYGVNDLQGGTVSNTAIETITANLQEIYTACKSRGLKVYQTTTTVRTNSTDNWATITNQTPYNANFENTASGGDNTWQDLTNWVKGNSVTTQTAVVIPAPTDLDGYFDVAAPVTTFSSNNNPVWQVGMVWLTDGAGLHPSEQGHLTMAAAIPTNAFKL